MLTFKGTRVVVKNVHLSETMWKHYTLLSCFASQLYLFWLSVLSWHYLWIINHLTFFKLVLFKKKKSRMVVWMIGLEPSGIRADFLSRSPWPPFICSCITSQEKMVSLRKKKLSVHRECLDLLNLKHFFRKTLVLRSLNQC